MVRQPRVIYRWTQGRRKKTSFWALGPEDAFDKFHGVHFNVRAPFPRTLRPHDAMRPLNSSL